MSKAVYDYKHGQATLYQIGYPGPEFANLDNGYRLRSKSAECTFTGIEHFTIFRYNQMVRFLIKNVGYQKGSYVGVFPTAGEARELLLVSDDESNSAVLVDEVVTIHHDTVVVNIALKDQHGLFRKTIQSSEVIKSPSAGQVEDCLIVRLNQEWIYLIDIEGLQIISQYRV